MKGYRGAKKKPTRLAERIGVKVLNPVNFASSRVVLMGVRVTVEFRAAITQIIAGSARSGKHEVSYYRDLNKFQAQIKPKLAL